MRTTTIIAVLAGAVLALAGCTIEGAEPTAVQPAEQGSGTAESPKAAPPIKLTAKKIAYKKDEFATGGPYTCARVVVTNNSKKNVEINQAYFAITGTDGEKREAAWGAAVDEFDTVTLAPGEKASGTVCSETESPAKVVTFTDPLFDEAARAEVAS